MRILSFRIQNFRSIIDSDWNNLAYDNITALIGQNESGKTSVLEALKCFYESEISENVIRSDMSMPEISCAFEYERDVFFDKINKDLLPDGFFDIISEKGKFSLTRKWIDEKNNSLYLDDKEVRELYQADKEAKKKRDKKIKAGVQNITDELNSAIDDLAKQNIERQNREKEYNQARFEFEKLEASYKRKSNDGELKKMYDQARVEIEKQKITLENLIETTEELSKKVSSLTDNSKYANKCNEIDSKLSKVKKETELAEKDIKSTFEQREFATSSKKRRSLQRKLDTLNKIATTKRSEASRLKNELSYYYDVIGNIFEGKPPNEAEDIALQIQNKERKFLSLEEIGEILFEQIPIFEFFEDFSSLLPDKIDLEDIVNSNTSVEGFKAANNFLTITELSSDFFNQKNNRILKQKIENLNGEINIDFHEYWQQKIGKGNKIKINFELEHYDFQNPEKKGKPYLEFWIKDDKERLYPKQRSRGVRWFLSFYLELKATALRKDNKKMVLLIDEPGVSLHARAQEDVLKVFEDIKDNIQIVYTTHSPHLINVNKLYRILAVQRAKEEDDYSETVVFDAESLNSASTDTLSPIYTLMGTKVSEQQMIQRKNNVIIEDVATYYYLSIFFKLLNIKSEIYLLPATDVSNVQALVNILMGWKLDFIVILDDDQMGNQVYNQLKKQLFGNDDEKTNNKVLVLDKCKSIEDLFSTIDFKKHILLKRVGITESNSDYIVENNLSRPMLASTFQTHIEKDKVTIKDFDEETCNNIEWIVNRIVNALN